MPAKKYCLPTVGIKLPLPWLWNMNEQKGATMKNALIRIMAVAVFATSISAFAMSEKAEPKDKNYGSTNVATAAESNVSVTLDELLEKIDQLQAQVQQLNAREKENQRQQETQQDETNKKIRQQEKEWDHSLLGIYGG